MSTSILRVTELCQEVKSYAKTCKNFDEFFDNVFSLFDYKGVLHQNEFNRLVQVAAIEANLE